MRQFFSCCLLSEFFHGDGTVRHFFLFVFCQHGDGSVEMGQCGNFFVVFLSSSVSCRCCQKKFIT